jgi:elongation factor Tu
VVISKFDSNENPKWEPDALAEVCFIKRTMTAKNGYRPHYKVNGNYLTTTHHWFIENGTALPNIPTLAFIKFITPEAYPNCLSVGDVLEVGEGQIVIGYSTIKELYNDELRVIS